MNKHTNPFKTIEEAMELLKTIGIDPLADKPESKIPGEDTKSSVEKHTGATYAFPWGNLAQSAEAASSEDPIYWREHILSVVTHAYYEGGSHYFECLVHLTNEGFDAVVGFLGNAYPVAVEPHLANYERHFITPDPLLKLFTLVDLE